MAQNSNISWTDDTCNFWFGCTEAGAECDNCYAREIDKRYGPTLDKVNKTTHWGHDAPRWIRTEAALRDLERSSRIAEKEGRPRRVFINSMSDLFEKRDDLDAPRAALWEAIPKHPMLRFLLLTKRPANITHQTVPESWFHKVGGFPKNVAIGTTVGNKRAVTARAAQLLNLGAYAHTLFFSVEPMLEPLTMEFYNLVSGLSPEMKKNLWVLIGGESGSNAREFDINAAINLVDVCEFGGLHPFVKQLGSRIPGEPFTPRDARTDIETFPLALRVRKYPPALL
jgi:protein gp37